MKGIVLLILQVYNLIKLLLIMMKDLIIIDESRRMLLSSVMNRLTR